MDTICPYCGCGCNIQLLVNKGKVVRVVSQVGKGPGEGNLCVKGRYGFQFIHHADRLTTPLCAKTASWCRRAGTRRSTWSPSASGRSRRSTGPTPSPASASARCTNEENYVFQKFMRAVLGTNNVDHCARL